MKHITTDLYEASYLLSQGIHITQIRQNRKTVLFQFEGNHNLEILKTQYDQGQAIANIKRFRTSMNIVKDKLFDKLKTKEAHAQ